MNPLRSRLQGQAFAVGSDTLYLWAAYLKRRRPVAALNASIGLRDAGLRGQNLVIASPQNWIAFRLDFQMLILCFWEARPL